jgi:hypothetical protein
LSDLAPIAESVTLDPLISHPLDFHVFRGLLGRCKTLPAIRTAVVWPHSDAALKGALEAFAAGLIEPVLIDTEGGKGDRGENRAGPCGPAGD